MDKEIQVWNKVLSAAMSMPGVKVNRMQYLRDQFATYRIDNDTIETAIEQGTIGNIPMEVLDKMAKSCRKCSEESAPKTGIDSFPGNGICVSPYTIIKKISVTLADHAGAVLLSIPIIIKVKIGTL